MKTKILGLRHSSANAKTLLRGWTSRQATPSPGLVKTELVPFSLIKLTLFPQVYTMVLLSIYLAREPS